MADLGYGAGLIFVAVTLVGDAMDGGGALDTVKQQADGTVIRALTEGHILMFGSIGCVMTALVIVAAAGIRDVRVGHPAALDRLARLRGGGPQPRHRARHVQRHELD